ncbi:MAG: hypothetical protein MI747_00020, partial [Desulfobacterales bacterium]|nr:hypothetical protein [Desulfobacterales bacterium]
MPTPMVIPIDIQGDIRTAVWVIGQNSVNPGSSGEGATQAQQELDRIIRLFEQLAASDFSQLGADTGLNLRDTALMERLSLMVLTLMLPQQRLDYYPDTVGDLESHGISVPPGISDVAFTQFPSMVVVLDTEMTQTLDLSYYRSDESVSNFRSATSVLRINPNEFGNPPSAQDFLNLVDALGRAERVSRGDFSRKGERVAWDLTYDLARDLGIQGIFSARQTSKEDSFTRTDLVDRVGFEEEFRTRITSLGDTKLTKGLVLGRTRSDELGVPVLQLEVEAEADGSIAFFELVTGPLTSAEYMAPGYATARGILLDILKTNDGTLSVQDILDDYNRRLRHTLGSDASRYELIPGDRAVNEATQVAARPKGKFTQQTNVLIAYGDLGTSVFLNSLDERGFPQARPMAELAASRVDAVLTDMGMDPGLVRPEMRAFVFQVLFNEMMGAAGKGGFSRSKILYSLLLRFSPEDAVFSVLNEDEVRAVDEWYDRGGGQRLETIIRKSLTPDQAQRFSGADRRFASIFDHATAKRLELGQLQLRVDRDKTYEISSLPGGDDFIIHSMPRAHSRTRFVESEGRIYGVVEYRSGVADFRYLQRGPLAWMEGDTAHRIRGVLSGEPEVSAYNLAAARFLADREGELAYYENGEDASPEVSFADWLTSQVQEFNAVSAPTDSDGRLLQDSEGWSRALTRYSQRVAAHAQSLGITGDEAYTQWKTALNDGFRVSPDTQLRNMSR